MKKSSAYPSVCTGDGCYQPIDLEWLNRELRAGRLPIVHACGRVLVAKAERPGTHRVA